MNSAERVVRRKNPTVAKQIELGGWEVVGFTKGKHVKLRHKASGRIGVTSSTPGDRRGPMNMASWMRRVEKGIS